MISQQEKTIMEFYVVSISLSNSFFFHVPIVIPQAPSSFSLHPRSIVCPHFMTPPLSVQHHRAGSRTHHRLHFAWLRSPPTDHQMMVDFALHYYCRTIRSSQADSELVDRYGVRDNTSSFRLVRSAVIVMRNQL